jgi:hypothetical protein
MTDYYDNHGDLMEGGPRIVKPTDYRSILFCLASDTDYVQSYDGYFKYYYQPDHHTLIPLKHSDLPLYISKKYKARKFLELF